MTRNEPFCVTLWWDKALRGPGGGFRPGTTNERAQAGSGGHGGGKGCAARRDATPAPEVRGDHAYRGASEKGWGASQPRGPTKARRYPSARLRRSVAARRPRPVQEPAGPVRQRRGRRRDHARAKRGGGGSSRWSQGIRQQGVEIMTMRSSVRDAMLAAVPSLRAFAISLCGNVDRADDLVQETLLRAMANIDSFQPGTNMSAWLFTILRNLFRSEYRKRRREVEDTDGSYAESLKSHPEQHSRVEFEEFRVALAKLPPDQREALILVGASGFSYEEAAAICDCAVGTIKSRVNRARTRLSDLLSIDGADDFGPDHTTRAILSAGGRG